MVCISCEIFVGDKIMIHFYVVNGPGRVGKLNQLCHRNRVSGIGPLLLCIAPMEPLKRGIRRNFAEVVDNAIGGNHPC